MFLASQSLDSFSVLNCGFKLLDGSILVVKSSFLLDLDSRVDNSNINLDDSLILTVDQQPGLIQIIMLISEQIEKVSSRSCTATHV